MNVQIVKLAVLIALTALVACGDGDNNPNNVKVYPKSDTGPTADVGYDVDEIDDTSVPSDTATGDDTGLEDVGPDATEPDTTPVQCEDGCGPGEDCVNDVCRIVDSCAAAIDLGTLVAGVPQTISGSLFSEGVEDLQATCNGGAGRERVVTFELSERSVFRHHAIWGAQYGAVVEIRRSCEDGGEVVQCFPNTMAQQMVLEAGRYYLVMDQWFGNAGDYELTVSAEPALCVPGVRTCDGNTLQTCPNPTAPVEIECAGTCSNGACQGTMCSNAIPVMGSGTFSGDGSAYSSNLNFENNPSCYDSGTDTAIPTPGFELVFYLGPLTTGQVVQVDAETGDANANAIFITRTCGDTGACAAAYSSAELVNWVVDADGEYYVIIDKLLTGSSPFNYSISVH